MCASWFEYAGVGAGEHARLAELEHELGWEEKLYVQAHINRTAGMWFGQHLRCPLLRVACTIHGPCMYGQGSAYNNEVGFCVLLLRDQCRQWWRVSVLLVSYQLLALYALLILVCWKVLVLCLSSSQLQWCALFTPGQVGAPLVNGWYVPMFTSSHTCQQPLPVRWTRG